MLLGHDQGQQSLFEQRRYELNGEKWIAAGLLLDQRRQRAGMSRLTTKRICN